MQQRRGDRRRVEPELGQDPRDPDRMDDEVLPALALVPLVRLHAYAERALEQIAVDLGVVLADRRGELVEEPAVPLSRDLLRTCSMASL